jgi:hypothetical protein
MARRDRRSFKKVERDATTAEQKMRPRQRRLVFDKVTRTWQWTDGPDRDIRA